MDSLAFAELLAPVTDHAASDDAGTGALGEESTPFWRDHTGFAAALGKPIVTLHDGELDHALKEVDRAAQATARTAEQVVDVLRYAIAGKLP